MIKHFKRLIPILLSGLLTVACTKEPSRVLIFTHTDDVDGFRHESIEKGVGVLRQLADDLGYEVEQTEDPSFIKEKNLQRYKTVVFLNTSHDVLDHYQQADFERFIQAGGGFFGIHGATATEYDWPWYGKLVGAYFLDHPEIQKAKLKVIEPSHESMDSIPQIWERTDEWYNFRQISEDLQVVMTIDESSYEGGKNGPTHPMAWYHKFDGGISYYTALGHGIDAYNEPLFQKHLKGALKFVVESVGDLDYSKARTIQPPEENRFSKVVLGNNLYEPTEMAVLDNGKVLFLERRGKIKEYNPVTGQISVVAEMNVYTEFEDGLMGLTLDPNFENNHWVYIYYSDPDESEQHLSRFEYKSNAIDLSSEVLLLTVPTQREECCHTGGSLAWDGSGNLFLSTGDNTNPFESDGYGPMDERPGRSSFDAQGTSANPNDLRGKILRIHPEADGSYTIPEGNLFQEGQKGTRPEIYVMGNRNPYRISIDKRTGFLYWGEVGPDAGEDSLGRGPKGHDEVNQARKAGNFGWPMFVGNNKAYNDYDFQSMESGPVFDPGKPVNTSPNNSGLKELPSAQSAFIWYPYSSSEEFPLVGEGGRNAMAGPVYYSSDYSGHQNALPSYFDGKLFIYDWIRGWIFSVTMNESGDFVSMEPFMPNTEFNNPMDMEMGSDGVLYMLEYGSSWYTQNEDARLVRIDYNAGNRAPIVKIDADMRKGSIPFKVKFSSMGTVDYDDDEIVYLWDFGNGETSSQENPEYTYSKEGIYTASLQVTDSKNNTTTESIEIWAGNTPAEISINVTGNQTFFWDGIPFDYAVNVSDEEDGDVESYGNDSGSAWVNVDVLAEGYDETLIAMGHRAPLETLEGKQLIDGSDCLACHKLEEKSIGPTYVSVADKYRNDENALSYLSGKIIQGGGGVWGDQAMAAHPQLELDDVHKMVEYILSLGTDEISGIPLKGTYIPDLKSMKGSSKVIIRASYADLGASSIPSILVEEKRILRSPILDANAVTDGEDYQKIQFEGNAYVILDQGGWASFTDIDLQAIKEVKIETVIEEGYDAIFKLFESNNEGPVVGSADLIVKPGMGPVEGSRYASATIKIDSEYIGDIVFTIESEFDGNPIGTLINMTFIHK